MFTLLHFEYAEYRVFKPPLTFLKSTHKTNKQEVAFWKRKLTNTCSYIAASKIIIKMRIILDSVYCT